MPQKVLTPNTDVLVSPGVDLNYCALLVFAPVLAATGILGFVVPDSRSPTSGAPAYNVFHIIAGLIGIGLVYYNCAGCARGFNIVFGSIDLYQAVASVFGWFPRALFRWKRADDILHVVLGVGLVAIGLFAA